MARNRPEGSGLATKPRNGSPNEVSVRPRDVVGACQTGMVRSRRMPLVTLDKVTMAYGHLPLLHEASFRIESRERVCVIGRNGTGKSTLLQIVSGSLAPQSGTVWHEPGLRIGRLAQDALLAADRRTFDVVAEGIADTAGDAWRAEQHVAMALSRLQIPADATMATLLIELLKSTDEEHGGRRRQRRP
jgi:ATP-binding cassette subfamily F protein uup